MTGSSPTQWQTLTFGALSLNTLYTLLRLRQEVFVVEQNCPYLDLDGLDQSATHVLGWQGDVLAAVARCLPPNLAYPGDSSIGRVIVAPAGRGKDLGSELMRRAITYNLQHWPEADIKIGAQAHLQGFYGNLGFVSEGDEYMEDGIAHIHMRYRSRDLSR